MPARISVLYVDDEPVLIELGRQFIEGMGDFSVSTAESVADAQDMLAGKPFDVIVSDYQMPGTDGIAFLKYARERYADTPFILFTGRGREEVVIEAINNGAEFYLQKGGFGITGQGRLIFLNSPRRVFGYQQLLGFQEVIEGQAFRGFRRD